MQADARAARLVEDDHIFGIALLIANVVAGGVEFLFFKSNTYFGFE